MKKNKKSKKVMLNLFPIFMALLLIISYQSESKETISYWADMTLQDLEMVHSQLEENTVAAINDSVFKNWLEEGSMYDLQSTLYSEAPSRILEQS